MDNIQTLDNGSIINNDLQYMTYDGWRKNDMQVQKGRKSHLHHNGNAYFSETQVKPIEVPSCPICGAILSEHDDCGCYAELHGGSN